MNEQTINRFKATNAVKVNDTTRVFGYSGGVPNLVMDAKKSGLQCNPILGGVLHMFVPGQDAYLGGLDTFTGTYPKRYVDLMPKDYRKAVDDKFHLIEDFGWRNLDMLTQLPYEVTAEHYLDAAQDYFRVVHPDLNECPFGLNQEIQTSDPEVGAATKVWQACPTCRLEQLRSEETSEIIFKASAPLSQGGLGMDSGILASLRAALIEACEAALVHVESKHQAVLSDIQNKLTGNMPGRNTLKTIDRIHLKMLHRSETKAPDMAQVMGQAMAGALKEAGVGAPPVAPPVTPPVNVLTDEEMAEYEAYKQKKAAMAKARAAKENNNVD